MAGKVNNPTQSYQEATNQLLAINQQRKGNLAQAKMEETLAQAQNNALAQASEFVASGTAENGPVNATFNPATQNILQQYGLGQPKIQRTSSSSQQVTKQNVVINNKTTNVTNNNVQVPAATGGRPIQGRPIQFQDQSQIRFKTWVSNAFAQQNKIAEKRQREYEKRDSELIRTSNKLIRKIKETGETIAASSMNPKNMASSIGKQLKTLLLLFGFGWIAKNWPRVLDAVTRINSAVDDIRNFFSEGGGLSKMFGSKDNEGPWTAFKKMFTDPKDGIFAYIKKWLGDRMAERSSAVKSIPRPDLSGIDILKNPGPALEKIIGYLGDILGAILDPTKAAGKTMTKVAEKEAEEYKDKNGTKLTEKESVMTWNPNTGKHEAVTASKGDMAIVNGDYVGLKPGAVDENGNLTSSPISSISQGEEIGRAIGMSKKTGKLQTASVVTGFSRLMDAAKRDNTVALTEEFLKEYIGEDGMKELGLNKPSHYVWVARPKTPEEMLMDLAIISKDNKKIRDWFEKFGTTAGFTLGGILGGVSGKLSGKTAGYIVSGIREEFQKNNLPTEVIELRRGQNAGDAGVDESKGEYIVEDPNHPVPNIYDVTPEVLQKIIDRIVGTENTNVDINDADFAQAVENSLIKPGTNLNDIKRDVDVGEVYEANRLHEQHKQEENEMWEESRTNQGLDYTKEKIEKTKNKAKEKVSQVKSKVFGKQVERVSPSDVKSGDLSGIIAASKREVFYSNESDKKGEGDSGLQSKYGHGYIPLGKDLKGFKHKCTSGPATFYYDGSGGKIKLNGNWWDTGSPKTATGTNIDKVGFKCVWNGTSKEGYSTNTIKATGFELQPGDIMLNFGKGKNGPSSHAQMWNGEEWISDTHQGQRSFVYRGGRLDDKSSQIWRYNASGEVTPQAQSELADLTTEEDGLISSSEFESTDEFNQYPNVLPEVDIVESRESPHLNYYSTNSLPESETDVVASSGTVSKSHLNYFPDVSASVAEFTPDSNITQNYAAYSKQNEEFTEKSKQEYINYTGYLASINQDLKLLQQETKLGVEMMANTVDATNGVITAVGNIKPIVPTPTAQSFTNYQYSNEI